MHKYFVTGTGTDIGKTFIACKLIKHLKAQSKKVMAIKPIISGWQENDPSTDTLQILTSLGLGHTKENMDKISPWRFKAPLAPSLAAKQEGKEVDFQAVMEFCKTAGPGYDYLFCEGAGGVAVPINNNKTMLNLMAELKFPALLICGTYLGAISHALTAVMALEAYGIIIHKIIVNESLNGIGMEETVSQLKNFVDYPLVPICRDDSRADTKFFDNLNAIL